MSEVSKQRQSFNYRALSTEVDVEIAPFESIKILFMVFGWVIPAKFNQSGLKQFISCC